MNTARVSPIAVRWVRMSHGRTRYFEAGADGAKPAVLLVHGAGAVSGGDSWLPMMGALAQDFHVLAPDCLGFGPGDFIDDHHSFPYLVDHLREFQEVLGVGNAHVVGHSMGGWLACLFAYESPDRVLSLVSVAGGGMITVRPPGAATWALPDEAELAKGLSYFLGDAGGHDVAALINERLRLLRDPGWSGAFARLAQVMSDPAIRDRYSLGRRLPQIAAPTMLLWGSDDSVNPPEVAHRMAALLPDARVVIEPGVGHFLPQEVPLRLVDEVGRFLRQVEPSHENSPTSKVADIIVDNMEGWPLP